MCWWSGTGQEIAWARRPLFKHKLTAGRNKKASPKLQTVGIDELPLFQFGNSTTGDNWLWPRMTQMLLCQRQKEWSLPMSSWTWRHLCLVDLPVYCGNFSHVGHVSSFVLCFLNNMTYTSALQMMILSRRLAFTKYTNKQSLINELNIYIFGIKCFCLSGIQCVLNW